MTREAGANEIVRRSRSLRSIQHNALEKTRLKAQSPPIHAIVPTQERTFPAQRSQEILGGRINPALLWSLASIVSSLGQLGVIPPHKSDRAGGDPTSDGLTRPCSMCGVQLCVDRMNQ